MAARAPIETMGADGGSLAVGMPSALEECYGNISSLEDSATAMTQHPTKTTKRKSAPAALRQDLAEIPGAGLPGKSFIELITVQWQRERSDLDLPNFLLAIYLMRLGTIIELAFGRQCEDRYRVSGSDMRVLFALRRGGPPYVKRPTDLFRALLITSGAITKKVDRLEALGMVERLQDP